MLIEAHECVWRARARVYTYLCNNDDTGGTLAVFATRSVTDGIARAFPILTRLDLVLTSLLWFGVNPSQVEGGERNRKSRVKSGSD